MPRHDEPSLRRPGFREGPRVVLADGQAWSFAPPRVVLFPARGGGGGDGDGGGGGFEAGARRTYGEAHEDRLDELFALDGEDPGSGYRRLSIQLDLAAGLLLRNYDLDDRRLGRLLAFDLEDEADRARWDEVLGVIYGTHAPKASAGGSAPASGPTESPAPSTTPTPSTC